MKKSVLREAATFLILVVIQAVCAVAGGFGTVLLAFTAPGIPGEAKVAMMVLFSVAFVAICVILAVKRAGVAPVVWFSLMAVGSVFLSLAALLPSLSWLMTSEPFMTWSSLSLCPITVIWAMNARVLPAVIYAALAAASALVCIKKRRKLPPASSEEA